VFLSPSPAVTNHSRLKTLSSQQNNHELMVGTKQPRTKQPLEITDPKILSGKTTRDNIETNDND
jgi:hypothetical protein